MTELTSLGSTSTTSQAIPSSQIVADEQPFGNDLSVPIEEELGGFLPIPDAEDNVLAILATEGLDETGERSHFTTASFGLNHGLSERMTIGGNVQAGYRSGVSVVLTLHCPRRLHQR